MKWSVMNVCYEHRLSRMLSFMKMELYERGLL